MKREEGWQWQRKPVLGLKKQRSGPEQGKGQGAREEKAPPTVRLPLRVKSPLSAPAHTSASVTFATTQEGARAEERGHRKRKESETGASILV